MCHIGVKRADTDDDVDSILDFVRESPRKKVQRLHIRGLQVPVLSEVTRHFMNSKRASASLVVLRSGIKVGHFGFLQSFLSLIDARQVIPLLLDVITKAALTQ